MTVTQQERRRLSQAKPENKSAPTNERGVSTISVHAGEQRQKPVNSITDPVVMASTFTFENTQSIIDFIEQDQERGEYGRYGTPGEQVVEKKLAALEGAEATPFLNLSNSVFVNNLVNWLLIILSSFGEAG